MASEAAWAVEAGLGLLAKVVDLELLATKAKEAAEKVMQRAVVVKETVREVGTSEVVAAVMVVVTLEVAERDRDLGLGLVVVGSEGGRLEAAVRAEADGSRWRSGGDASSPRQK